MAQGRSVDDLVRLLEPRPLDTGPAVSWTRAEDELGLAFPDEYKRFAEVFGSGVFEDYVSVYSPVQTEATLKRFLADATETLDLLREWDTSPYPVEDLLPWGEAGEGRSLFVLPDGRVVLCDDAFSVWEEHPGPVSLFLLDLLTGRLDSELLPFEASASPAFWPSASGSR